VPDDVDGGPPNDAFHAVFVGSGGQRKGLHHLLLAWSRATLPPSSKLTLVCRVIDSEIERLAAASPRVEIKRGVRTDQLNTLYAHSSLFVMPSLVEGFGQVYLEALAHGCPVLGTANTGLPDLGGEDDGIFVATPGDVDELTNRLEKLAARFPLLPELRLAARACAGRHSWPSFRKKMIAALAN
jgi:glycosyltransferase involved in cell wall biosynthesis